MAINRIELARKMILKFYRLLGHRVHDANEFGVVMGVPPMISSSVLSHTARSEVSSRLRLTLPSSRTGAGVPSNADKAGEDADDEASPFTAPPRTRTCT